MQFYLQSAVAEKGIGEEELPSSVRMLSSGRSDERDRDLHRRRDGCDRGYRRRRRDPSAADAAQALEPVAGRFAEALFGIGQFGRPCSPRRSCRLDRVRDLRGVRLGERRGQGFSDAPIFFGIYTLVWRSAPIAVLLVPEGDLVGIIVGSQYLQGILLPIVLVFIVPLVNDRRLMGKHANRRGGNALAWGRSRWS
jgi:Mn2+/Fe2+ NRAMP family transporter